MQGVRFLCMCLFGVLARVRGEFPPGSARGCGDGSSKRTPDPRIKALPGGSSPLWDGGAKRVGV